MKYLFFIISFSIISFALSSPKSSSHDTRMLSAIYNGNDVTKIYTKTGYTTAIKFSEDERIQDIASGFTDGYHFIDRSNILFVSPKPYISKISVNEAGKTLQETIAIEPTLEEWKTNLIVITNKREYVFDLILAKSAYYKVSFKYPKEAKVKRKAKQAAKAAKRNVASTQRALDRSTVPRNWDFYMNINPNSDDIAPNYAYDDGVFTYLGFDTTKSIPSVFKFSNGKESILNTHIKKDGKYDVLVVHKTTPMIVLRSGDKIIGVLNNGYAKNPLEKTKTTINDKVVREVLNGQ